jgi:hypothetical protein
MPRHKGSHHHHAGCCLLLIVGLFCVSLLWLAPGLRSANNGKATLTWTAPGDPCDDTLAQVSQYDIRYSTAPLTATNWNAASVSANVLVPGPVGSGETLTILGLKSNTVYFFGVKSADASGNWSALSNIVSVRTVDAEPPLAVSDLTVTGK